MVRVVVSDPENGKAYQLEPEEEQFRSLVGLRIGDTFDGSEIGLSGYELVITGGSDQEGFSMRSSVRGRGRTKALLKGGAGYNPKREGERRRKTIRGNVVSGEIAQLNTKVKEKGGEPIEKLLGLEPLEEEGLEDEESGEDQSE